MKLKKKTGIQYACTKYLHWVITVGGVRQVWEACHSRRQQLWVGPGSCVLMVHIWGRFMHWWIWAIDWHMNDLNKQTSKGFMTNPVKNKTKTKKMKLIIWQMTYPDTQSFETSDWLWLEQRLQGKTITHHERCSHWSAPSIFWQNL